MAAELAGKPFTSQAGGAREQLERSRGELAAARQELTRLERQLPVYQAELTALESLRAKHYVSELEYNAKKRDNIDAEQNLQAQHSRIQAMEAAKQQHRNQSLELKAPQAGIVKDLATHTAGTVVSPGTIVLSLVPDQEKLLAEVQVRNEDIGRLKPGLPVHVKVHAFRFQRYGMLGGTVEKISPDTSSEGEPDSAVARNALPTYKAVVSMRPAGDGEIDRQPLTAGMTVTAEIDVGTRTPFEYLVDPVSGVLAEAGRE